jgi:thiosulfate/3-mercaptopyruvate sulfurtransferase
MASARLFRGSFAGTAIARLSPPTRLAMSYSTTGSTFKSFLVSPQQLAEVLRKKGIAGSSSTGGIVPLCAAWFLPNDPQKRTGGQVFKERRIPGARFFDLDAVCDHDSNYPHMLPTAEAFAEAMSDLGIKREDEVVVYDTHELGIFSAPRVAWTLKVFGHPSVHILNNFRLWVDQGHPVETGTPPTGANYAKSNYKVPTFNPDMVVNFREMKDLVKETQQGGKDATQVIDARSNGRFNGTEPEPRPGMPNGHMPGSINVPLPEILDSNTKAFLSPEQLKEVFLGKGIDSTKPIICSCGTGVTAAALDTALQVAKLGDGFDRRVYDGSWT